MQNVYLLTVYASLGWLGNVSGLILSVPPKQRLSRYILTTMSEEMLAASAL
jgi:hypothetical protein